MGNLDMEKLLEPYQQKIQLIGNQHPRMKECKQLLKRNNSKSTFILEGIWAHERALKAGLEIKTFIFCPDKIFSPEGKRLVIDFIEKTEETYIVSSKLLAKICERDEPDGLISIGAYPNREIEELKLRDDSKIIILDGLETPGNLGTIIRTCEGAGVDAIFICNRKTWITNPKVIKGSMGASLLLPIIEFESVESCVRWLEDNKFNTYLADPKGDKHYYQYDYNGRSAVVMGNERYGISEKWYKENNKLLSIPMYGESDSLNVSIAGSIIIYEMCVKKTLKIGG